MKCRKIVVTGSAGFIGSNLAWALCGDSNVVVICNPSTGRIENIKQLVDSGKIHFVKGGVTDPELMRTVLNDADSVLHQAARARTRPATTARIVKHRISKGSPLIRVFQRGDV